MAKGKAELQAEHDKNRRAQVDAANRNAAAKDKAVDEKLAGTPLTDKERSFCEKIASKMNKGRHVDKPCAADILRYSKLRVRLGIAPAQDKDAE